MCLLDDRLDDSSTAMKSWGMLLGRDVFGRGIGWPAPTVDANWPGCFGNFIVNCARCNPLLVAESDLAAGALGSFAGKDSSREMCGNVAATDG